MDQLPEGTARTMGLVLPVSSDEELDGQLAPSRFAVNEVSIDRRQSIVMGRPRTKVLIRTLRPTLQRFPAPVFSARGSCWGR